MRYFSCRRKKTRILIVRWKVDLHPCGHFIGCSSRSLAVRQETTFPSLAVSFKWLCLEFLPKPLTKGQRLLSFCCYAGKISYTEHILRSLCSSIQHILNKNAIACRWVVNKNMGYCAYQLAILDDR